MSNLAEMARPQTQVEDDFYTWHKIHLIITDRCNLVCRMCPIIINDPKAKARKTLPRELALQVADFAKERGAKMIEIAGGEATVVDYFWDLLDRVCSCDAEVRLVTNGLMTTDEHIAAFARYPNLQVQISIDGVGEVHDRIRGVKRAFERSANTLERLCEAGCKKVSVNTVVQRTNLDNMVETYEYFRHLPLLYHAFSLVEGVEAPEDAIFPEDCDRVMKVLHEIKDRADRDGRDVILSDELLRVFRLRTKYPYFMMHPGWGCTVVQRSVTIFEDGRVVPCLHRDWNTNTVVRNLHQRTLAEIVDSEDVQNEIRRAVGPNGCRGCSTMCYNWDPDFQRKVMRPSFRAKAVQAAYIGKEYVRENYPAAFNAAKKIYRTLPT